MAWLKKLDVKNFFGLFTLKLFLSVKFVKSWALLKFKDKVFLTSFA